MSIEQSITTALGRYGEWALITAGEVQKKTKIVIQPLLYKNKMYLNGKRTIAGLSDDRHFLLIAPPEKLLLQTDATVAANGVCYCLRRSEMIRINSNNICIWAVAVPCTEDSEDDYDGN